ncbi:histidine triad nucleotide-binding protein [bacterium]|jgi:histidine triad (HIT) family protein|nr:histidine triad nucleotide-binding protein [bacterium]
MAPNCLFCGIVAGEIPASVVYENEQVLAFRDIDPKAPTHILVIPKRHITDIVSLSDQSDDIHIALSKAIRAVADQEELSNGFRVVSNVGVDGGQTVFHLHYHVLGGRELTWPPG